jgi:hypothetical protein
MFYSVILMEIAKGDHICISLRLAFRVVLQPAHSTRTRALQNRIKAARELARRASRLVI